MLDPVPEREVRLAPVTFPFPILMGEISSRIAAFHIGLL